MKALVDDLSEIEGDSLSKEERDRLKGLIDVLKNQEFDKGVELFLDTQAKDTEGAYDAKNKRIYINVGRSNKTGKAQSAASVFVEEQYHSITVTAISLTKNPKARNIVRKIEKLMDLAQKSITPEELDNLRDQDWSLYDYIFKGDQAIAEFVAKGLAEP